MGEHKCSSSGSRSARETVKVFKATKSAINNLESRLQKEFERRAGKLELRVRGGTKGNIPTKAEAADLLLVAWKRIPEAERAQMIKDYIDSYRPVRRYLNSAQEDANNVQ